MTQYYWLHLCGNDCPMLKAPAAIWYAKTMYRCIQQKHSLNHKCLSAFLHFSKYLVFSWLATVEMFRANRFWSRKSGFGTCTLVTSVGECAAVLNTTCVWSHICLLFNEKWLNSGDNSFPHIAAILCVQNNQPLVVRINMRGAVFEKVTFPY